MLAAGGAWLVAIQTFAILIAPNELPWIVPGLAIGMFAVAVKRGSHPIALRDRLPVAGELHALK